MSRVIVAGTYDPDFGRNRRLLALLDAAGHDVVRCHVALWRGARYEIPNRRLISTLARAAAAYPKLVWRFSRSPRHCTGPARPSSCADSMRTTLPKPKSGHRHVDDRKPV